MTQDNVGLTSMKRSLLTVMLWSVSDQVISSNHECDSHEETLGMNKMENEILRPISSVCAVPLVVIGPLFIASS